LIFVTLDKPSYGEKDSLHILPLGILPLRTVGLRQARMIKNSRLEGVIELYRNKTTGSGQILTEDLPKVFQIDPHNSGDLDILHAVSRLPSYDVYSLRIELRRLGIDVEDKQNLKLSAEAQDDARPYMLEFTRPLIDFLRTGSDTDAPNDGEIMSVLTDATKAQTRDNFIRLAARLEIQLSEIPTFLEDYRDVYLSLAYYDLCANALKIQSQNALRSFASIRIIPNFASQAHLMQSMQLVERGLTILSADVGDVIEDFKYRTVKMWEDISAAQFKAMSELVHFYQTRIGASLCAAAAKVSAWDERFPPDQQASQSARAAFVHSDMAPGLAELRRLPKPGREALS
jgi:hypothetical protein